MLKQVILGSSLLLLGLPTWADVIIQSPEEIVVVAVDDQEIRGGMFKGKENTLKLDAGQHNISVKYQEIFNHLDGEHDVLRSNIVTLNQVQLKDGEKYQLTLVNAPKEFEQAKVFAQKPTIAIKNSNGQVVAQQTGASSEAKPWLSHGIFGSVLDLRQDKDKAAVPAAQTPVKTAGPVSDHLHSSLSKDQQLIELWKSANPQERQKFTAWLGEQASK